MDTLDILRPLIAFDTVSRNPNLALMEYVADLLDGHGIASTLIHDETGTKANLYATVGDATLPGVMLSGHTDVVPIDGQAWTRPAFELTSDGNRHYGRGTTDMKGFVACAIAAAIKTSKRPLKSPLHLALSYDEEVGCVGVRSLIDMLSKAPAKPAMCIVGEPTNLAIATGHKGKIGLRAICTGREGHSALAPLSLNALHLGADFITLLRTVQTRLADHGPRDGDYDIPFTTLHAGVMKGGTALNIVPNHCEILFEIRSIAQDDPHAILAELQSGVDRLNTAVRKEFPNAGPDAGITIEVINSYPGLDTPADAKVVAFVKAMTGANSTMKVAFGTEAGLFSGVLGIPCVVCGPGSMAQGHKPDEYIEQDQLTRCDAMLEKLLKRLETGL